MAKSIDISALPDDEGYIYLDDSGVAQTLIEVTITLAIAPEKAILVTLDKA